MLSVRNLSASFHTRAGIVRAVRNVSFDVAPGETLGIVGESGSGKSVTCYSMMGLIPMPPGRIESGSAMLDGTDLLRCPEKELRAIRGKRISMIFQDPMTSLDPVFRVGDRVMQIKNNYDVLWTREDGLTGSGIFNGDVGQVEDIDPAGELMTVRFDDRTATYVTDMLGELELAYAVTVHKSQGSEYRAVVLVALPAAPALMVRGVLYTGVTRARELLIVVGDDGALARMAANDRQQRRYSGLRWRLKNGTAG